MTTIYHRYGRATHGTGLPVALIRDVWALVTEAPQMGMTLMGRHLGTSSSQIARALRFLRAAGYIEFKDLRAATRRVLVPLIEVET